MTEPHVHGENCPCSKGASQYGQSLDELDFERGLWGAAVNGDLERVERLLQNSGNPNVVDNFGYSPLIYASRNGKVEIVKTLLRHGADPNLATFEGKSTALHRAASLGHTHIVLLLVKAGALSGFQDAEGQTALHKACENKRTETAEALLAIDPRLATIADSAGKPPMMPPKS